MMTDTPDDPMSPAVDVRPLSHGETLNPSTEVVT
jgi:hypothetical protein